jgi:hypothetical protein
VQRPPTVKDYTTRHGVQHVHRFLTQALLWSNRGTGATSMSRLGLTVLGVFVANPPVAPFNPSAVTGIISSFTDPAKLLQREHKKSPTQAVLRWARGTP